jgi:transcription initiation factor TFIIIB Brf1 subunit/transcription initiation factor TFIIB
LVGFEVGVVSKCGSVDSLYGEVASRLGLRIRGPPPASRACSRILAYVVELALKLNLPDDVVREAERVVLELSMRGFTSFNAKVVAVVATYLACRLKGYTLPFKLAVHTANEMGWNLEHTFVRRMYRKIVYYTGITPPPQSREQARQASLQARRVTLLHRQTVEPQRVGTEPSYKEFIERVAGRLGLPDGVVKDAIGMVGKVGVRSVQVAAIALYLSCLKHGIEVSWGEMGVRRDIDYERLVVGILGLDSATSFLAVRAYKRIISWAETGYIQVSSNYRKYIKVREGGVVELEWSDFMLAFDLARYTMSDAIAEQLAKMGVARVRHHKLKFFDIDRTIKIIEIDVGKLRELVDQIERKQG